MNCAGGGPRRWSTWAKRCWPWASWTRPWKCWANASNSIRPTRRVTKPGCGPRGRCRKKAIRKAAEKLLLENLNGESLTPESKEWRDSLFALGKLLAEDGRHLDAIERLEEAVARYPDSRQAIEARYLIAEACLQAAKVPQEKAATDTGETARLIHRKQAAQLLERAIHYYQETEQVLNRRQEQTELTPLEKSMLRNSYFSVGSALVDLGRWEDAIQRLFRRRQSLPARSRSARRVHADFLLLSTAQQAARGPGNGPASHVGAPADQGRRPLRGNDRLLAAAVARTIGLDEPAVTGGTNMLTNEQLTEQVAEQSSPVDRAPRHRHLEPTGDRTPRLLAAVGRAGLAGNLKRCGRTT